MRVRERERERVDNENKKHKRHMAQSVYRREGEWTNWRRRVDVRFISESTIISYFTGEFSVFKIVFNNLSS